MYRLEGPSEMRSVGETEFVNGSVFTASTVLPASRRRSRPLSGFLAARGGRIILLVLRVGPSTSEPPRLRICGEEIGAVGPPKR